MYVDNRNIVQRKHSLFMISLHSTISAYRKPFLASTVHDKPFLVYDFIIPNLVPLIFASAHLAVLKNT